MKEDEARGWADAPAAKLWRCPACQVVSPVEEWKEISIDCETCGDHDGRECPRCGELFDGVFEDSEKITDGEVVDKSTGSMVLSQTESLEV